MSEHLNSIEELSDFMNYQTKNYAWEVYLAKFISYYIQCLSKSAKRIKPKNLKDVLHKRE